MCKPAFTTVALALLTLPLQTHAAPDAWKGGTGLWSSSANWTAGVPTAATIAAIDNGLTTTDSVVIISGAAASRTLAIDSGDEVDIGDSTAGNSSSLSVENLTNAGLLTTGYGQADTLTFTGTFTNTGTIGVHDASILNINGSNFTNNVFTNNGLIDVSRAPGAPLADLILNSGNATRPLTITGSGNISVHGGGTLSIVNSVNLTSTGYINADSVDPCILVGGASNITIAGLTGNGSILSSGGNLCTITLNTPANAAVTYGGAMNQTSAVVKNGAGTQVFSGNNTYYGATDINAGTLEIDNPNIATGGAGYGNITAHAGGTLAGAGSTDGFVTIADGGTVSPGTSAGADAGTFTAGITLLLNSGSALRMDISNDAAASDLLRVANGEFEASNVNVQLAPRGSLTWHSTIPLINWYGAVQINGNTIDPSAFHLLPSGVMGSFLVDTTADTVSFYVLANAGDANEDGKIDLSDLSIVLNHFGAATSDWTLGNFDGAPNIDLSDLSAVLNHFGQSSVVPAGIASAPAPEPTTFLLLGAALPLFLRRSKKQRSDHPLA
ncbi:MAG: autotransporter-associated beta strand repeat-containing protein [Phycisphaerae bacterium]